VGGQTAGLYGIGRGRRGMPPDRPGGARMSRRSNR